MSKITATFDGLQINIEGAENVTAHQLWIASHGLATPGEHVIWSLSGEYTIAITLKGFSLTVDATEDIEREHLLALSAEFALAAQHIFSLPRLSTVVQKTFQAIAEQAQAQQIMAGVKRSPGGVLTPH